MKQINNAYAANDFDWLYQIEQFEGEKQAEDISVTRLREMLIEIENMILLWKEKFSELRMSEWYIWKKRKEKKGKTMEVTEDMFANLERKLLDDIVKKIEILKELKTLVIEKRSLVKDSKT